MSYGKRLEVYNSNGEKAPDEFIKKLIDFEQAVYNMRREQREYGYPTIKESKVDTMLENMGYSEEIF